MGEGEGGEVEEEDDGEEWEEPAEWECDEGVLLRVLEEASELFVGWRVRGMRCE